MTFEDEVDAAGASDARWVGAFWAIANLEGARACGFLEGPAAGVVDGPVEARGSSRAVARVGIADEIEDEQVS